MCKTNFFEFSELFGDRRARRSDEVRSRPGQTRPRAAQPSSIRKVGTHQTAVSHPETPAGSYN